MNIILVGMPGSGKTTVARELKKITGFRVVDTDALIVERHGEINEIFRTLGEKTFRDYESEIIAEVCKSSGAIISTGGGSVLRGENARLMKNCGKIVYLRASVETILKRTATDNSRPLLAGEKRKNIERLLSAREEIYSNCADIAVDTDGLLPEEIASKITELLK